MKWFKHSTTASLQEGIAAFIDECGMTGYGAWWIICEKVTNNTVNIAYPTGRFYLNTLRKSCGISKKKLIKILDSLQNNKLLEFTIDPEQYVTIAISHLKIGYNSLRLPSHEWAIIRASIFSRDDYTCQYCGERGKKLECDHVLPVAKGGTHTEDNLVAACFKCNRSKRDKLLEEWLQ